MSMGVYINGMEMPKSCYYCPIANDGFYLCKATSPFKELEDDCEECKPQWCPLIPVPEHGRLIDVDALFVPYDICDGEEAMEFIKAAPTIIPASEEGE